MTATLQTEHLERITADVNSTYVSYMENSKEEYKMSVKFIIGRHKEKLREYDNVLPHEFFNLLNAPSLGKALISFLETRKSARQPIIPLIKF